MDTAEFSAQWNEPGFWNQLSELEARHQCVQVEHEALRRQLDCTTRDEIEELMRAWRSYCRVIEQLDQTTHALEQLRLQAPTGLSQLAEIPAEASTSLAQPTPTVALPAATGS